MRSLNVPWQNPTGRAALGPLRRVLLAGSLILCTAALAMAGTLKGTVTNGTTKRPVANAEVVLLELQSGMVPVGKVKTDAHGRFRFTNDAVGKAPMLLQTTYRGVSYYESVNPGDSSATIEVYDANSDPKSIVVASHAIILHDNGSELNVEEQYVVENLTKPPVAFYSPKATFSFPVPDGAQFGQVSTWTGARIPTRQKTTDLPNHRKAIDWAFRPGKSIVRISYLLPYPSKQATFRTQSPYSATHVFLAAPPGVQVRSEGFNMIGTQEGYNVYARQAVPAETALVVSVSGVSSAPAGTPGARSASADSSGAGIATLPARHRNLTWVLAVCAAVVLFLVTMYFWRKSAAQQALSAASGAGSAASKGKGKEQHAGGESPAAAKLDGIKDRLLQLELRHQAGTLSEEDYARERKQVEETLRELLKG